MKRARPGGSLAKVVAGDDCPTRMIVARIAMRTALRRPDSTRNGAPSYRNDAVSTSSDGRVAGRPPRRRWVLADDRYGRRRPGGPTRIRAAGDADRDLSTARPHASQGVAGDGPASARRKALQEGRGAVEGVVEDRLEGVSEARVGHEFRVAPGAARPPAAGRSWRTGRTRPTAAGPGSGWPASGRSGRRSARAIRADGAGS